MKSRSWIPRLGIVVISAILVEIISILQYRHFRSILLEQMSVRSRIVVRSMADEIGHALELTEYTMRENLWNVQRSLIHPDSVYTALTHMIDDAPHVTGICLAFLPDYYPSRGTLYEPYISKENGVLVSRQLAGPDHDYTQNETFRQVVETGVPTWSDPYIYGPDSLELTTYSFPVRDKRGRLAAVCGLDMDLSWLGDTLNAHQHFRSAFGLLLNGNGELVAYPSEKRTPWKDVQTVVDILEGKVPASAHPEFSFEKGALKRSPHWQVVQVYNTRDLYARLRKMREQQLLFILLGLAILAFMINRYARNERKLHLADETNARISGELRVASEIQKSMLPHNHHHVQDDVDVCGSLVPAREVGGDLYDYFIRDGKLFFCIGDVSGKGAPSAMLMAVMHALFRSASAHDSNPSRIMNSINETACQGNDNNMFVTLFVGVLDLPTGLLRYCDAGHDCPIILEKGALRKEKCKPHLPVGVFPDTRYGVQETKIAPDSTIFLYTDGLTEAKNEQRELFGLKRVEEVLGRCAVEKMEPEQIFQAFRDRIHSFVGNAKQSDDLTMLCIHYTPRVFDESHVETIVLKNEVREVERLSSFMKLAADKLDLEKSLSSRLRLAVEEAAVNVIKYAYPEGTEGEVHVRLLSNDGVLRIQIIDSGIPFDPTTKEKADTSLLVEDRQIGGLGILLVRELMDSINYERSSSGQNILTMTKKIK